MMQAEEIFEKMMGTYQEKTGLALTRSSDMAVRLYAAAAQIESLYVYGQWVLDQSFPQTAAGTYLDAHAQLRGLSRKTGTKAEGVLRFSLPAARQSDVTVEAGTVCASTGLVRFVTTEEGVIPAGSLTCDVAAEAESAGAGGNTGAGTITVMTQPPAGIGGCTNPEAFTGGSDPEEDEALRARILESYSRLPNGVNSAFYKKQALSHEGVEAAVVLPRHKGTGTVGVVIAGPGGQTSQELVQQVQAEMDAVREIGTDVEVSAPETVTVTVSAVVWPKDNVSFDKAKAAAEAAIRGLFTGGLLGKPVYTAELGNRIYNTGLVKSYQLLSPAADTACTQVQLPVCGTVTVTEGT